MVAPLLGIVGYTLYANLERAKRDAYDEIHDRAEFAARVVDEALDLSERLVMVVAEANERSIFTPEVCERFLQALERIDSARGTVLVTHANGALKCSSSPVIDVFAQAPIDIAATKWFAEASAKNGLVFTSPFMSRTRDRAVAMLTHPLYGPDGQVKARVAVSLDLEKLEEDMRSGWSAQRGVVALVSANDTFLVRSPGTRDMLGKSVSSATVQMRAMKQSEVLVAPGADGRKRVFAAVGLSRYGLRVAASIPEEDVLAAPYAEIRRSGIAAGLACMLAALLGWFGTRSLSGPMRSLSRTAQAHARNETDQRADESLPGEFGDLAVEMNALLDARLASDAVAVEARRKEQQLARFYECLLRTNQAIHLVTDQTQLFQRLCDICCETGQATMAWVGVIAGDRQAPVAWGGAAASHTAGLEMGLGTAAGTKGASIRAGEVVTLNDYMNDPRTLLNRESASAHGIRSGVHVPLKQAGIVIATLNLYANETHFFDGAVLRLLEDLASDVSAALDRFGMAAEHARTLGELKASESSLAGVVSTSLDAIVSVDSKGIIRLWNGAAERMFGARAEEVIGQSSFEFVLPERARVFAERLGTYASNSPDTSDASLRGDRLPVMLKRRDSTKFPALASFGRFHLNGEPMMVTTLRDASDEQEARQAREAAAASESASKAKNLFMSRMSHELRTPLNVVLGFSQLLQESAKRRLDERERKQLDLIFLAGAQLRALVDDVLDYSVIESGKLQVLLQDCEVTELLDGVIRMSESGARAAQVRIEPAYEHLRPFWLHTDPVRLRQVMLNLLSNATKYNRPGGAVIVSAEAQHGLLCIEVTDTGMGMSDEQLAGLFQPFNRLGRENTDILGTGIGMVLVRQLVELMGGKLTVKSSVDQGTAVRVELPRPKISAPVMDGSAADIGATAREDEGDEPMGTILYIEDNPVNVMLVEEILRVWQHVKVIIAEDGESGIQQAVTLNPDLVLLDMQLPDMSGVEVLTTLAGMNALQRLTVVGLSASAMDDEVAAARAVGVRDYWKKPVDVAEFRRNVRNLLSRPRPRAERAAA